MNGTWRDEYFVKIIGIKSVTHDVKRFRVTKPTGYQFIPGEATDIVINQSGWKNRRKPFTFTGLNDWDILEFTIKIYSEHHGFTDQLDKFRIGDELILHDSFGAFHYQGDGVFIAGGAGVTPFIAILRQLQKENRLEHNRLIFSNKTVDDIILKEEFELMMGDNFINVITRERTDNYDNHLIDEAYLKEKIQSFARYFYVCGPDAMVRNVGECLLNLGADKNKIIIENTFI